MFDKIHAQRLTHLANHLENAPTLLVGKFDFSIFYDWNTDEDCGTTGCAAGEAALLWPEAFPNPDWENMGPPATEWFGLSQIEFNHLFMPNAQTVYRYRGQMLPHDATRYDVAAQIRAFLAVKAAQIEDARPC